MKTYWIKEKSEVFCGVNIEQILTAFFSEDEKARILENGLFDEYCDNMDHEVLPNITLKQVLDNMTENDCPVKSCHVIICEKRVRHYVSHSFCLGFT